MQVLNEEGQYKNNFSDIFSGAEKRRKEIEIKKERLKQKILFEWKQSKSTVFWNQCFVALDYKIIFTVYSNIQDLIDTGYAINNPAAFFVHTLKKTGYYPFKQEEKNNGRKN